MAGFVYNATASYLFRNFIQRDPVHHSGLKSIYNKTKAARSTITPGDFNKKKVRKLIL